MEHVSHTVRRVMRNLADERADLVAQLETLALKEEEAPPPVLEWMSQQKSFLVSRRVWESITWNYLTIIKHVQDPKVLHYISAVSPAVSAGLAHFEEQQHLAEENAELRKTISALCQELETARLGTTKGKNNE